MVEKVAKEIENRHKHKVHATIQQYRKYCCVFCLKVKLCVTALLLLPRDYLPSIWCSAQQQEIGQTLPFRKAQLQVHFPSPALVVLILLWLTAVAQKAVAVVYWDKSIPINSFCVGWVNDEFQLSDYNWKI